MNGSSGRSTRLPDLQTGAQQNARLLGVQLLSPSGNVARS